MKITKKILIISAVLLSCVWAAPQNISYNSVHAMPTSVEKDYYIWRLLAKSSTTKSQAMSIIKDARRINSKLSKAYTKKTGLKYTGQVSKSRKTAKEKQRKQRLVRELKILFKSSRPFATWLTYTPYKQVELFNSAGKNARKKLNHTLTKRQWNMLSKVPQFNKSLKYIRTEKLAYLKKGFAFVPTNSSKMDGKNSLRFAFVALGKGDTKLASRYFQQAKKYPKEREELDTALFWLYKITNNKKYLNKLLKSYDINIYSLTARDIAGMSYPSAITPNLPTVKKLQNPSYLNPIYWANLKKQGFNTSSSGLINLANSYKAKSTIGYYTWLMARASNNVKQYFPMPYRSTIRNLPQSRQSILYAIARQESRFVPGSVSTSYALGMMQIMPFLVRHLAKERHEKIDYDDMFNPVISLKYANTHMNYLNKWIQHPLFVSYAYNAGIGFTKRMLKKGNLFRNRNKYDPFWSMEMLNNNEARRYGKHVLSNYVIYMNKLGVPVRLSGLLKQLHIPSNTDKFRKR